MIRTLSFRLNGKPVEVRTDPGRMLLWVLRHDLGMTGAKFGCGQGFCGACTVLLDGEPIRSCATAVKDVAGKGLTTIEGLEREDGLHPVQEAFLRHHAFQCGYCTSGMILASTALLEKQPHPTRADIAAHLEGHLCRCGSHPRIVDAVLDAAGGKRKGGA
ncbi:MAG TPA: (2Fe-2S)-binding protein [Geothrix sp.]|nr:(2Fe-2S)-binding protein [Geothrix sp.]